MTAGKSFHRIKCLTYVLEDRNWTPTNTNTPNPTPARARVCFFGGLFLNNLVNIIPCPYLWCQMQKAKCFQCWQKSRRRIKMEYNISLCNLLEVCFYFSIIQLIMVIWLALLLYCSSIYTGVGTYMYWINYVLCCNICWCSSSDVVPKYWCSPCT